MVSLCYTYMVSSYVIRRLWYGELVLYMYGELLCNLQKCDTVSSCYIYMVSCYELCRHALW